MWFWLFIVSFIINVIGLLYVRWLLKIISNINQDIEGINISILQFSSHLKTIYEMEMFYGDETLQSLMSHATQLSDNLQNLDLILNEDDSLDEKEESIEIAE